jgi:hypothetical protein
VVRGRLQNLLKARLNSETYDTLGRQRFVAFTAKVWALF